MGLLRAFRSIIVFCGLVRVSASAPLEVQLFPSRWHHVSSPDTGLSQPAVISAPGGRKAEMYGEDYILEAIEFSDEDIGETDRLDYYIDEGLEYYLDENLEVNRTRFAAKDQVVNVQKLGKGRFFGDDEAKVGLLDEILYKQIPKQFDFVDSFTQEQLDDTKQSIESKDNDFNRFSENYDYFSKFEDNTLSKGEDGSKYSDNVDCKNNRDDNDLNLGTRFGDSQDMSEGSQETSDGKSDSSLNEISNEGNDKDHILENNSLNSDKMQDNGIYTQTNLVDYFMTPKLNNFFNIKNQVYRLKNYKQKNQEKLKTQEDNMDEIMEAVE